MEKPMTVDKRFLAFDFGAESGRALLGTISGGKIALDEIHRFPNTPVKTLGAMHWDALRLFGDIKHGLRQALSEAHGAIDGIGIDTWGVDFGLIGSDGELLGNP
jgi:rhamnulokinase